MNAVPRLQVTQYRLAQHYLNKLRTAADAVRRGRANLAYGLSLFDQDWEQIKHWQAWSTQYCPNDETWAHLCRDFSLVGLPVLALRSNQADLAVWLETALKAAQQLHDYSAERAICHELEVAYYRLGVLEKIEHFARQLLKLGKAAHDPLSIGRGFAGLGIYAVECGRYAEAERHFQRALQMFIELGIDTEIGRVLNGLGITALYLGDYQNAYQYYSRHLQWTETTGTKSDFCTALLSVGDALTRLKDYAQAEKYIKRGIEMCRTFGFQRLLGVGLFDLGEWALEQNQLELARSHFEEGLRAVRAADTQRQIVNGLFLLGYTWLRLGNLPAALAHLQEGLQMARAPHHICDLQRTLGYTYLALSDFDAARRALHTALSTAQAMGSHPQKASTLSGAVAYWQRLGRHEQAAIWAGVLVGDREVDETLFNPVCTALEAALGSEAYHKALEQGKMLGLDQVVSEALTLLTENR